MPDESAARRDAQAPATVTEGTRPSGRVVLVMGVSLAVAIAIAAVALGLTVSRSDAAEPRQESCGPTAPKLSVVGTGQATVSPNLLTVVVQVDAGGSSAASALATDNVEAADALATLKEGGVLGKDISTSGLSLQPQYAYPKGVPTVTGYEVDNTVTATLRDISKSGAVIDAVVGSAGNALQIESIGFSSAEPGVAQNRARARAATQAVTHARALARAAGRSLGPVCSLTDQSQAVEPTFGAALPSAESAGAPAVPISSGQQTQTAQVSLVYALGPAR
jgi:uncharacterized protein YggE